MHEKRHENAENPENVTFCHNNGEKSANQMLKNVTYAEKREFLSRKKVLVSFLHSLTRPDATKLHLVITTKISL
jgi:hypothetical protein